MSEEPTPPTLAENLASLSNLKTLILDRRLNASCTCCMFKVRVFNGLNDLSYTPSQDAIEMAINQTPPQECEHCTTVHDLYAQFDALKLVIYQQIGNNYGLLPENNPFTI